MRVSHCFGVCALLAALTTGASAVQASPLGLTDTAGASALATFHHLQNLVQWNAAHVAPETPNFIDPCWLVDLTFWNEADPQAYQFRVNVVYKSGNKWRNVDVVIPVRQAIVVLPGDTEHDHGAYDTSKWIRVRTEIDVSNHIPNADSQFIGSVRLEKTHHHHDHDGDDGDDDDDDHDHGGHCGHDTAVEPGQ
jgi:hypothetical protein